MLQSIDQSVLRRRVRVQQFKKCSHVFGLKNAKSIKKMYV